MVDVVIGLKKGETVKLLFRFNAHEQSIEGECRAALHGAMPLLDFLLHSDFTICSLYFTCSINIRRQTKIKLVHPFEMHCNSTIEQCPMQCATILLYVTGRHEMVRRKHKTA